MASRPLLLLAALALLLAGCADPRPPAGTGEAESRPTAGTGEADQRTEGQASSWTGQADFAHDGQTASGGCVYTPALVQCQYPTSDNAVMVDLDGPADRVSGRMTWDGTPGYALRLFFLTEGPEGWQWEEGHPYAEATGGTLEFDWDVAGFEADAFVLAANAYTHQGVMPGLGAGASVPFDFHLEGVATGSATGASA